MLGFSFRRLPEGRDRREWRGTTSYGRAGDGDAEIGWGWDQKERRGTTSYGGAGGVEIAWEEAIGGCGEMEGTSRNDWRCRNSMGGGQRPGRDRERRGTTSYGRWEEAMTRLDDGAGDAEIAWDEAIGGCGEMEGTSRNDWRCRNSMGGGQSPGRDRERRGTTSYGRWEEAMTRLDDGAGDAEIAWDEEAMEGEARSEGKTRNDELC